MNTCRAIFLSAALLLVSSSPSARADTSIGDGGAWLLTFGSAVVTGANLISLTLTDGSEALGIAGAVIGTTLVTYSLVKDVEDAGTFAGFGMLAAGIGAASFFIARDNKKDARVSGLHMTPCIVPGREHAAGLELSYRW